MHIAEKKSEQGWERIVAGRLWREPEVKHMWCFKCNKELRSVQGS